MVREAFFFKVIPVFQGGLQILIRQEVRQALRQSYCSSGMWPPHSSAASSASPQRSAAHRVRR